MGIAVAAKPLRAPLAHESLPVPRQALAPVADQARADELVLAPRQPVERVRGRYLRHVGDAHGTGERDELKLVPGFKLITEFQRPSELKTYLFEYSRPAQ